MLIQWHGFLRVNHGKPLSPWPPTAVTSPVSAQNLLRHPDGQRRERPPKQRPIAAASTQLVIGRSEIQALFSGGASETVFFIFFKDLLTYSYSE